MTALGRLHLRVLTEGVSQDVILERRWPDAASARAWCERVVRDPAGAVVLQEAHVFTERWRHPRSWEIDPVRAVPQSDQAGAPDPAGGICWAAPCVVEPPLDTR
ncbi:MAG TPA: hypothetical protein VFL69_00760 [Marmoricola sp.]|nr:hypothetical protein [Marmoricola sp.]